MNSAYYSIIALTFRELWSRKITLALFIVSTLIWLTLMFALGLDVVEGSLAGIRIFGQSAEPTQSHWDQEAGEVVRSALSLEAVVIGIESFVAGAAYWAATLLGLFATAPLLGTTLQRGRVDLMLSKPVGRSGILAAHVLGVVVVFAVLTAYLMGMVWLVMSVKAGIWYPRFLIAIPISILMFTVMYSVVVLATVTTDSTALALIVSYGLIFVSIVFLGREQIVPQLSMTGRMAFMALYHVLPNFAEVTGTVTQLARNASVTTWYPTMSAGLFGIVMYVLTFRSFQRRDY